MLNNGFGQGKPDFHIQVALSFQQEQALYCEDWEYLSEFELDAPALTRIKPVDLRTFITNTHIEHEKKQISREPIERKRRRC